MKTKRNILISAAGGSLFPYIFTSFSDEFVIHTVEANPVFKKIYQNKKIHILPKVLDKNYIAAVVDLLQRKNIEFYIPLIDEEIPLAYVIAQHIRGLKIIAPKLSFVKLCLDKFSLMKKLSENNISHIHTLKADLASFRTLKYPVFVKPIVGRGSRGSMSIMNKRQLDAYFLFQDYSKKEVIIQDLLIGQEYTVSVTVNNKNKILAIVPKKVIEKKGVTIHAVTKKNKIITKVCQNIVEVFMPEGSFNVQLILVGGTPFIFEINPRFSTTSILTCEAGVNEFELCIQNYDKTEVTLIDFKENVYLYRRWESCFYE